MKTLITILGVFLVALMAQSAFAGGYALFDAPTDTISVSGNSVIGTAATIEARVKIVNVASSGGIVFNEFTAYQEDKLFAVRSNQTMYGYLFGNGNSAGFESSAIVSWNTWHHIAYVYDGSQERFYLDGIKVSSRAASGDVYDYSSSIAAVGATNRGTVVGASFEGLIDTLRVSTIARYTGDSFTAPTGDLTSDAYTNLLYNFDEPQNSTVVYDLSGNGRDGYLGIGNFAGATSPTLVPEPTTMLLLGLGGLGLLGRKRSIA